MSVNPPSAFASARPRVRREFHRPGKFLLGLQQVGGNIDDYRPGTPAARPVEALGNCVGNFVNGANQAAPFGEGEGHAKNIGLLKRIGSDQRAAHLAGDAHQGNRIHLRIGNAGDKVRRAGPAGRHGHANFTRDPRIAFRRKDRALLMAGEDMAHSTALKRVIQRHDCAAGITKHQFHALGSQALQNNVRSL